MFLPALLFSRAVIPAPTISLTEAQRLELARLVASEPEVKKLFRKIQRQAEASLHARGHPVARIGTAAKLSDDPVKIQSQASLEDMKKLEALGFAYAVTSRSDESAAARRIILRWAEVNQPTGIPIDETKLEPLFVAYDLTRSSFSPTEKELVENWLRKLAALELQSGQTNSVTASNNWNSHRLKIVGLIGFLLQDETLITRAVEGFKKQIEINLQPDGSSFDFHHRDALHYHCYDLEPLLALAIAAHQNGLDLYSYQAATGASLPKSVDFLVPYCDGTRTHAEWVHSKVKFDRQRAEAGEAGFVVGAPFNPKDAHKVFELAAFFEPRYKAFLSQLNHNRSADYLSLQMVLNKVRRK